MNWNEELKHWSANDDLGISRYRAFQLTKNQVHPGSLSFRIIETPRRTSEWCGFSFASVIHRAQIEYERV